MYLTYALCFMLAFTLNLFVWATAWLWALIPATFKLANLPGPLWYLQTHDDWVYGFGYPKTLMYDSGEHPCYAVPPTWWQRYKLATWWLARNPGYAFDTYVLGMKDVGIVWGLDPRTLEDPEVLRKGIRYTLEGRNFTGFGYRRNLHVTEKFYFKVWLGWHWHALGGSRRHMLKIAFGPKWS